MSTASKSPELPQWLQAIAAACPRYADRRAIAAIISHHMYQISHRTLERWPVPTVRVNGKAVGETREWLAEAFDRIEAAARIAN